MPFAQLIEPAVQHVEYIKRQGKFSKIDNLQSTATFSGFFISSADTKNICDGLEFFLYKTDNFGCIKNSANGIEVSNNASPTTLAIALLLAYNSMNHQPLVISGSDDFKESVIKAAVRWDVSRERRQLAERSADLIFQNISEQLKHTWNI